MEIKVQFFGKFNITYNGTPVVGEKVHKESQFNRLMLALLYAWPNGVDKDDLERFAVGENEMSEKHTALRIIIYKTKRKLVKLGLPDINLIYQEKGIVYWCKEIPVVADCHQMEDYYAKAEAMREAQNKEDIEKSMLLYMDAAYLYKGEFLELFGTEVEVAHLAKKYRELFVSCINHASKMMEKLKDWDNLEMLGRLAVSAQPFCNWEILVMEALIQKRMYEDATTYYSDVVDLYLKECGIYPSEDLMHIMDELEDSMQHSMGTLESIQAKLEEREEAVRGGYYCSFPVFKGIYQMIGRQMDRTGLNAHLMLCSMTDPESGLSGGGKEQDELSSDLKEAIEMSIRRGDMFTRYGKGQYLILLFNTGLENCKIVQKRINSVFSEMGHRNVLKYHARSINYQKK